MGQAGQAWIVSSESAAPDTFLCAGHAGSGASTFHGWAPGFIDCRVGRVQLPGREARYKEPLCTDLSEAVRRISDELEATTGRIVLYGQSLGALLCFELARSLAANAVDRVRGIIVASRRAPQLTGGVDVSALSDEQLLSWLKRVNGGLEATLEHPKWRRHFLPIVRADLMLSEGSPPVTGMPALAVPMLVVRGTRDPIVSATAMRAWSRCTTGPVTYCELAEAGHVFTAHELEGELSELVRAWTRGLRGGPAPADDVAKGEGDGRFAVCR